MKRREFITMLGGAAAPYVFWPLAARAQPAGAMRRIGVLSSLPEDDPELVARRAVFEQALQGLGWSVGRNLRIDYRWTRSERAVLQKFAADLAVLAPDVILVSGDVAIAPMLQAAGTTPIVFVQVIDPVGSGFVESMSRPGGNVTGFTQFEYSLAGKWLELLKEIAPRVTRVAVVRDPTRGPGIGQFAVIQALAPVHGVELVPINANDPLEAQSRRIAAFAASSNGGSDHDGGRNRDRSRCADRRRDEEPPACDLSLSLFRRRRRPDLLWPRYDRPVPPRGRLCGPHPQGREAG